MTTRHNQQTLIDTLMLLNPTLTPAEANEQIKNVLSAITKLTNNDDTVLMLRDFGTFTRTRYPAKKGHNPGTMETVLIPETSVLRFKASHQLRRKHP